MTAPTPRERLLEALRRDLKTLAGPPEYLAEPDLRELLNERVKDYRSRLVDLKSEVQPLEGKQ